MATKTKLGKVAYRVLDEKGVELEIRGERSHALVRAQRVAEFAEKECALAVVSAPLFGPSHVLYRVTRTKDGIVHTLIVNEED